MNRLLSLFFIFLIFFVGCGKQKPVKERLCAYLDLDSILEMVPRDQSAIVQMGAEAREAIEGMLSRLKVVPVDQHNYDNTIDVYDEAKLTFIKNKQILNLMAKLSEDHLLRMEAYVEINKLVDFEKKIINHNPDLYKAFHDYYKLGSDYQHSTLIVKKFLEKQMKYLDRHGALLSKDKSSDLLSLQNEISNLQLDFDKNKNCETVKSISKKRNQLANLLGFSDFADYDLSDQMVKDSKIAERFLWTVVEKLQLCEEPNHYYVIKNFKVSSYFPVEKTVYKIIEIFERFFHFEATVENLKDKKAWAPDLICYKIRSLSNNRVIGYLFFDLYDHAGKDIGDSCCMKFIPSVKDDCTKQCAGASVVVAKFEKPQDRKDLLLQFDQVRSLFYEIGQALHNLYGAACFSDYSGTKIMRDFLEVSSEFAENFVEQPEVLRSISSHHETGESLSNCQIDEILKAERFGRAERMLKQAFLALVSLELSKEISNLDCHEIVENIYKKIFIEEVSIPDYAFERSLIDFVDYGPSLHNFLWSKVVADDLFDFVINNGGVGDRKLGQKYMKDILSPGGFWSPASMIKVFLGRSFSINPFVKKIENGAALNYN